MLMLATFLCASLSCTAAAQEPAAPTKPTPNKWALLIGVVEYPRDLRPEFGQLFGPRNDVAQVAAALRGDFQFGDARIHTLVDKEATLEAVIKKEFAGWLIPNVAAGDVVFIYFAGHGSLVPDLAKGRSIETSESDSTFVLWDSRSKGEKGARDFTDDELQSLLAPMIKKGAHVFVVTDACHSEGGMRGSRAAPVRAAPRGSEGVGADNLPACWPSDVPFLDDRDPRRPLSDASVHFGACGKDEQAFEYLDPQNDPTKHNGVFTRVLLEVLARAKNHPDRTYDDLYSAMLWSIPSYRVPQNPAPEGSTTRLLFDGQFRAPPGLFRVSLHRDGVIVEAGRLVGVQEGTRLRVLERNGEKLGFVTVTRVDATTCFAQWEADVNKEIDSALYADWESAPAGAEPIVVFDPTGELEAFLGPMEFVHFDRTPRYYLAGDTLPTRGLGEGRRWKLAAPDGVTIFDEVLPAPGAKDADVVRESIRTRLQDEVSFNGLLRLPTVECDLKLEISFRPPSDAELAKPEWIDAGNLRPLAFSQKRRGPEYRCEHPRSLNDRHLGYIEVVNRSDRSVHVYVLSLMPDHTRALIFPNASGARTSQLEPRASDAYPFVIRVPEDWPSDRPYLDQYIVIATTSPLNTDGLLKRSGALRGGNEAVPRVIADAMRGDPVRGARVQAPSAFGVAGLKLWIDVEK